MERLVNFDSVLRLRLGRAERRALDRLASARGLSVSELVRQMILAGLRASVDVDDARLTKAEALLAIEYLTDRRAALAKATGRNAPA